MSAWPPEPPPLPRESRHAQVAGASLHLLAAVTLIHVGARLFLADGDVIVRRFTITDAVARGPLFFALVLTGIRLVRGSSASFAAALLVLYGWVFAAVTMLALGTPNEALREENGLDRILPVLLAWLVACAAVARTLRAGRRTPNSPGPAGSAPD